MTVLFSEAELDLMRLDAEGEMLDTFTAHAPGGTTKDADGYDVPGFTDEGSTPGKLQGDTNADTVTEMVDIGGERRPVMRGGLHVPISAPLPTAGDSGIGWEYECAAVGPGSDPSLLGRRYLVVNVPSKSYATARRLDVVEV